jgi:hypothetical protein
VDAGFLLDNAAVLGDTVKRTFYIIFVTMFERRSIAIESKEDEEMPYK